MSESSPLAPLNSEARLDQIFPTLNPEQIRAFLETGEGITFKRGVTIERIDRRGDQKVCVYKDMATGELAEAAQHGDVSHLVDVDRQHQTKCEGPAID